MSDYREKHRARRDEVTHEREVMESRAVRDLIAGMKLHGDDEWRKLAIQVEEQKAPSSAIEHEFCELWVLIGPFVETEAKKFASIKQLHEVQQKCELQLRCVKALRQLDLAKRRTVWKWLQIAIGFQDAAVQKRVTQQVGEERDGPADREGYASPRVESVQGKEERPELCVEKDVARASVGALMTCFRERLPKWDAKIAVALWLGSRAVSRHIRDDKTAQSFRKAGIDISLGAPEEYPPYLPRALQRLLRELASGSVVPEFADEPRAPTNVWGRRICGKD